MINRHSRNVTGYVMQEVGDRWEIWLETGEQLWITKPTWNCERCLY